MNRKLPYQKLLRDSAISNWSSFQTIYYQLQEKASRQESIAEEIFALKVILDEQCKKWFIIATNSSRTNDRTKHKMDWIWHKVNAHFEDSSKNEPFTKSGFWKRNRIKILLQVLNLDFFIYGDTLRTNFKEEGVIQTIFEATRRNLALSTGNNLLFYGVPILLISIHPLYTLVLLASFLIQAFYSYQRTIRFYYLNGINEILGVPRHE